MARPKLNREDCADIRRLYADRSKHETTGTLARLFRVSTGIIHRVIENRYTPLEDYEAKKAERNKPTKMQLTLEIKLGNDAMQTTSDVQLAIAQSLRKFVVNEKRILFQADDTGTLMDENGNTVGRWEITE